MKTNLSLLLLPMICTPLLFAQDSSLHVVRTTQTAPAHVAPAPPPAGLTTIYSNLNSSQTNLYLDNAGWAISGPNGADAYQEFIAMPFTPKSNSRVLQARVAVLYDGYGANQVDISLYSDSDGAPGTLLAGPVTVTNLPSYPNCCQLATASFGSVAVSAGTQYWITATTPESGAGSDFTGNWQFVTPAILQGANVPGFGWYSYDVGPEEAAGEVLGTVPGGSDDVGAGAGSNSKTKGPGDSIGTFTPTSGPAGTVVSITGTNLTQTYWLKFNGVYSDGIKVYSNTLVTATVPTGATTGPISITFTSPGGYTASTATSFTVTP